MSRWHPSTVLPLSTRAVAASDPDVLVTHLAIPRAGGYDRIGRTVVYDDLERFQFFTSWTVPVYVPRSLA